MEIPAECIRKHNESQFQVQDQISVVKFSNPAQLRIEEVTVDDCVFDATDGERCDYLVQILQKTKTRGNDKSVLIELKGSDIQKAFDQLVATNAVMAGNLNKRVWWVISHSGRPNVTTTSQILKEQARRLHKTPLLVGRSTVLLEVASTEVRMVSSPSEWS